MTLLPATRACSSVLANARRIAKAFGLAVLVGSAVNANAACWFDSALHQQAQQLASELFPDLQSVPRVHVCTANEFTGRMTGLFRVRSEGQSIWIHQAHASAPDTRRMLIHELAHALTYQKFGGLTFAAGHGLEWMRIMVPLGEEQIEDARSHAHAYPEALPAFEKALAELNSRRRTISASSQPAANVTQGTVFANSERDLKSLKCAKVLMVPATGGIHGYVLGAQYRSVTALPLGGPHRVRSYSWPQQGTLELDTSPSPDGTPSLLCLA